MKAVIVDGIRNIEEMKVLESLGTVKLLAIHGCSLVRFKHVKLEQDQMHLIRRMIFLRGIGGN